MYKPCPLGRMTQSGSDDIRNVVLKRPGNNAEMIDKAEMLVRYGGTIFVSGLLLALPLVAALALAYAVWGAAIPGEFGHPGLPMASLFGTLTIAGGELGDVALEAGPRLIRVVRQLAAQLVEEPLT